MHIDRENSKFAIIFQQTSYLVKNNTFMVPQPPYFSNLVPCDTFLFPKLKRPINCLATIEDIKTASKEELNKITKKLFF